MYSTTILYYLLTCEVVHIKQMCHCRLMAYGGWTKLPNTGWIFSQLGAINSPAYIISHHQFGLLFLLDSVYMTLMINGSR